MFWKLIHLIIPSLIVIIYDNYDLIIKDGFQLIYVTNECVLFPGFC